MRARDREQGLLFRYRLQWPTGEWWCIHGTACPYSWWRSMVEWLR